MGKRVLHSSPHLWNVHFVGDGLVFEHGTHDASPVLFHVVPGGRVREIAKLSHGRPRGVLRAVEDGRLICCEADGTLSAIDIRTGRRFVIRQLQPMPAAVAITPEQVVWGVSETRALDGGGTDGIGQVWRWWRGTEQVECLGEQPSFRPDLVVADAAALGASAMTSPVYLAADQDLGVIETDGLRWLDRVEQPIRHLACSSDAALFSSQDRILRRDHKSGETSIIHRAEIPMGLAVHDTRLVVARNSVIERRQVVETSAVIVVDLATGAGTIVATDLGRPGALAAGELGIALVEGSLDYGGVDRLVLIDWDTAGARIAPQPILDDAIWQYPFSLQWWHPDGSGGYFSLDREGNWQVHGSIQLAGRLDPDTSLARFRELEAWRDTWREAAGPFVDMSTNRGWQVGWGIDSWFRSTVDPESPAARAVAAARELVVAICPAFADIVRSLP